MSNYPVENQSAKGIVREDEIYSWFSQNESKWNENGNYRKFLGFLKENSDQFCEFVNGQKDGKRHIHLENLRQLGGPAFRQHLILLLAARKLPDYLFDHLCVAFESLMLLYFVTRENARNYEVRFAGWANKLRGVTEISEYKDFLSQTIEPEFSARKYDFQQSFLTLSSKSLPTYRLRYILAKIAVYIESERSGGKRNDSLLDMIDSSNEIEHIAPQNPKPGHKLDFENYEEVNAMLGNLTLLEKSINASIGRGEFFDVKLSAYGKSSIYLTKSLARLENIGDDTAINRMNRKLEKFDNWNQAAVITRQKMLQELAMDVWTIPKI